MKEEDDKFSQEFVLPASANDIFGITEYIKCAQFSKLKTEKSKITYVSKIHCVHRALNWSSVTGPLQKDASPDDIKSYINAHAETLVNAVPVEYEHCKSPWNSYISVLAGRKVVNTADHDNTQVLNVDGIYLGAEFLQCPAMRAVSGKSRRDYVSNTKSAMRKLGLNQEDVRLKTRAELEYLLKDVINVGRCSAGWGKYLRFLIAGKLCRNC